MTGGAGRDGRCSALAGPEPFLVLVLSLLLHPTLFLGLGLGLGLLLIPNLPAG
jgi:hypothetical protein